MAAGVQSRHALIICGPRSIILKAWDARTWCNGLPVVGEITLNAGDRLRLGSAEFQVDAAFEVPFSFVMNPGNHKRESRIWEGKERFYYSMPFQEHNIWGVTAGILRVLYERLHLD